MGKKRYLVGITEQVYSTIAVMAESEDEALELANEAWCDYDEHDWSSWSEQIGIDIVEPKGRM